MRVERLARSVSRWRQLTADIAAVEADMARLLALTDGQVLTTLPGVKDVRAACFSAFTLPIGRFPTAEHLYSATGLAPASYRASSIDRAQRHQPSGPARTSRCPDGHPLGAVPVLPAVHRTRGATTPPRDAPDAGPRPIARHAYRLIYRMLTTQDAFDEQRYRRARHQVGR